MLVLRKHKDLNEGYAHIEMKVLFYVDSEDILLHSQFITTSHNKKRRVYSSSCYEEEIIFLNRDPKGRMIFKTSDIYSINKQQFNKLVNYVKK